MTVLVARTMSGSELVSVLEVSAFVCMYRMVSVVGEGMIIPCVDTAGIFYTWEQVGICQGFSKLLWNPS